MSDESPTIPLQYADFGDEATHFDLRYPTLTADGRIFLNPQDGAEITTVPARSIEHFVLEIRSSEDLTELLNQRERNTTRLFDLQVMVTDARVIFYLPEKDHPGQLVVSHIRYPWISQLGFRPKQSFLNGAALELQFLEEFSNPDDGSWFHRIEIGFEKDFHPGQLTLDIARRAARHNLVFGAPEAAKPELKALAMAGPLPDPVEKGGFSSYIPGAYVPFPSGISYHEQQVPIKEWIVQE